MLLCIIYATVVDFTLKLNACFCTYNGVYDVPMDAAALVYTLLIHSPTHWLEECINEGNNVFSLWLR